VHTLYLLLREQRLYAHFVVRDELCDNVRRHMLGRRVRCSGNDDHDNRNTSAYNHYDCFPGGDNDDYCAFFRDHNDVVPSIYLLLREQRLYALKLVRDELRDDLLLWSELRERGVRCSGNDDNNPVICIRHDYHRSGRRDHDDHCTGIFCYNDDASGCFGNDDSTKQLFNHYYHSGYRHGF